MTALRLTRVAAIGDLCVLGRLTTAGADAQRPLAKTLEQPWRNNAIGHSCIPPGMYEVKPRWSEHNKRHFAFDNEQTAPRTAILMHSGNVVANTIGCILVGKSFGMLMHEPAVLHSRAALNDLLAAYPDGFTLCVEGFG